MVKQHRAETTSYDNKAAWETKKPESWLRSDNACANTTKGTPFLDVAKDRTMCGSRTFDALVSDDKQANYSFTLLEATYREKTRHHFEPSDYVSFGLANEDGFLTNAGKLFADQPIVDNSRLVCTHWKGLEKSSLIHDALDAREFKGNLIYLLQHGHDFISTHSKVRFAKEAMERIDKPDYADRAYTEALVNALIHRDYLFLNSVIHIDMYTDRLEISSPGSMVKGRSIQECDIESLEPEQRNPIIAKLFQRMRYMECCGSGLKKILSVTAGLYGYTEKMKPQFFSTPTEFRVILQNMNYPVYAME